ncbi:hypothetical protein [Brevibacillus gelatini]
MSSQKNTSNSNMMKKINLIFFPIICIALLLASLAYYFFWYNTPENTIERYLTLIKNKQGEPAYEYVYKNANSYYPEREDFLRSVADSRIVDFKIDEATAINDTETEVKVLISYTSLKNSVQKIIREKEQTFMVKKVSGEWLVSLRGPDGES